MNATIMIRCMKPGCPRKKRIHRAIAGKHVPENVAEIHQFCPWHDQRCDKGYPEYWYDSDGNLIQET